MIEDLVLSDEEPGAIYQRCVAELARSGREADYALTETIVYATELRYALDVLAGGGQGAWNFGDTGGTNDQALWDVLDGVAPLRLAFVGSGPYPVTARLVLSRYPEAQVDCLDNNITGYLVGKAVLSRLGLPARALLMGGASLDYSGYTAVLVAAMVSGKRAVVERALATCAGPVVVRGSTGLSHERLVTLPAPFTPDGVLRP
jgi:hypothetical protein